LRSAPKEARNAEICHWRLFSSTIRSGHTRHQRTLGNQAARRQNQRHQQVKSAIAELDKSLTR
jgi:hypothetical protein